MAQPQIIGQAPPIMVNGKLYLPTMDDARDYNKARNDGFKGSYQDFLSNRNKSPFFPTPTGEATTTANQEYNKAVKKGFKGSFAQWMSKAQEEGALEKLLSGAERIKGLFTKDDSTGGTIPSGDERKPKFEVSKTTKIALIIGGIALVGLIGFGVYKAVKGK